MSPHSRPVSPARRAAREDARITLRPSAPDDLRAIAEWWPAAAATVRGVREPVAVVELQRLIGEAGAETLVIARVDAPAPIGLLVFQQRDGGWLEFRFLALADGHRGWGFGSQAVRLIEESGRAVRFAAEVFSGNGLGLYFWLRMGYRPGKLPWRKREAADRLAMICERKE